MLNRTSARAQRASWKPWSGGLAAGFLGLISASRGSPPPAAQPRRLLRSRSLGLRLAAGPFAGFPARLGGTGPATSLWTDLTARPGPAAAPSGRPARLGGGAISRALPGPAPRATTAAAAGAPGRGPAAGRADPAGLADVLDGFGLEPGPVPHR